MLVLINDEYNNIAFRILMLVQVRSHLGMRWQRHIVSWALESKIRARCTLAGKSPSAAVPALRKALKAFPNDALMASLNSHRWDLAGRTARALVRKEPMEADTAYYNSKEPMKADTAYYDSKEPMKADTTYYWIVQSVRHDIVPW